MAFVHMPTGLNIPTISDLHAECHTMAYIQMREQGDELVKHCLDSKLQRETKWSRKKSATVQSHTLYTQVEDRQTLQSKKKESKNLLSNQVNDLWHSQVKELTVQVRFLELLCLEQKCVMWKSIMYNMPARVLKFLVNSVTDTLNTRANLVRWGKSTTAKCKHCPGRETLNHVLNACPLFLEQGRYTWRHNNILAYLVNVALKGSSPDLVVTHDIPNIQGYSPVTTIPRSCTQTNLRPDLCLYRERDKKLLLFELTIPFELGIERAHKYKADKYASLITDIQNNGYEVQLLAVEIGSRGFISQDNAQRLKSFLSFFTPKPAKFKELRDDLSQKAVVSSFVLYCAKNEAAWEDYSLLEK